MIDKKYYFVNAYVLFLILVIISCKNDPSASATTKVEQIDGLDYERIGQMLIDRADVQPGERVLLVMEPGSFNPIISVLRELVVERQGLYLGAISVGDSTPVDWQTKFTMYCQDKTIAELEEIMQEVDLGIMLPGAQPAHPPYKALQNILENGIRRTIHFHWAGAYDLNGNLLETDADKAAFYQDVLLNTDYTALAAHQSQFENAMRGNTIRVTTPAGTDIQFEIGDRPVTKQDGDASAKRAAQGQNLIDREIELPAGAIRVAPIESSVNGKIAFPDADWDGERVLKLMVRIEDGKIVEHKAMKGGAAVQREFEKAGVAGKSFREFALGFNPMMTIQKGPTPWIPYYGYGAGIVRLSLGDNTELGGNVGGGYVRWNFFPDATVTVGDEVWVEDGVLKK